MNSSDDQSNLAQYPLTKRFVADVPQSPPSGSTADISEEAIYPHPQEYGADVPQSRPLPAIAHEPQPPGLIALNPLMKKIYPNQCYPFSASPEIKYWNGGTSPLDCVTLYSNHGVRKLKIPPHWHYISWGLSDLHGDGRVHNEVNKRGFSGFGFELTFRLLKVGDTDPPLWPIHLMQTIAKYVFKTGNAFYAGDHINWYSSLDGGEGIIKHILLSQDAQLPVTKTPFGTVRFVQIVGACLEEVNSVKRWKGPEGVLKLFQRHPVTGGAWLITNMHRDKTIFEIDSSARDEVAEGIKRDGSNLCGISAGCSWNKTKPNDDDVSGLKSVKRSLDDLDPVNSARKSNKLLRLQLENDGPSTRSFTNLSANVPKERLYNVHIRLTLDAAMILPSVLNGRIRQGHSFTFQSFDGDCTITFALSSCTETVASNKHPIDVRGTWLHVFISDSLMDAMESGLKFLKEPFTEPLPKTVNWPERNFTITVHRDYNSMP